MANSAEEALKLDIGAYSLLLLDDDGEISVPKWQHDQENKKNSPYSYYIYNSKRY